MSVCIIDRSRAAGTVAAPPSKSYAHRLLIAAFLSGGARVGGVALSRDIEATLGCIRALGGLAAVDGDCASVTAGGAAGGVLPCNESGSTLRFMIPIALALQGGGRFTGTEKLFSRGIGEYEKIFAAQGISCTKGKGSLQVSGQLRSGEYTIDGSLSSQYITGLMFALPLLQGESRITILPPVSSRGYIAITADVLRRAGVEVRLEGDEVFIPGGQRYSLPDCTVEGDWSNAAFLEIYNCLGGDVTVTGLNPGSLQGDRVYREHFAALCGGRCTIDLADCIDLGPVLFTLAALKHGARFVNAGRLRIKESDRIGDIACELEKIGARVVSGGDEVEVFPAASLAGPKSFSSHNDHRIAMSLAAVCSLCGGSIEGCEAVEKSYPAFFSEIGKLGISIRYE